MGKIGSYIESLFVHGVDEPDPAEEGYILNSITHSLTRFFFAPKLPAGFSYCTLDPKEDNDFASISDLLRNHYIKSNRSNESHTLYYPDPVLRMMLHRTPPEFNVGIRFESELIAYANIMQQQISIKSRNSNAFVIDFLVIHGDFRGRRLTPSLFAWATEKLMKSGQFNKESVALFTYAYDLPLKRLALHKIYHRPIRPIKLMSLGMMPINKDLDKVRQKFSLENGSKRLKMTRLIPEDSDQTRLRLYQFLENGDITPNYTKKDFEHFFMREDGATISFIRKDNETVTDFATFYRADTEIKSDDGEVVNGKSDRPKQVLESCLIHLKDLGADMVNITKSAIGNEKFSEFSTSDIYLEGTGTLRYYLVNWRSIGQYENIKITLI